MRLRIIARDFKALGRAVIHMMMSLPNDLVRIMDEWVEKQNKNSPS